MPSQTNVYPLNPPYLFKDLQAIKKALPECQWLIQITLKSTLLKNFLFSLGMLLLFCFNYKTYASSSWQTLAPGIEYQDLEGGLLTPWSHIHVFRVDLTKNKLALVRAKTLGLQNAQASTFARYSHALISINGGFFDEHFNSLGLRINNDRIESPLKRISWWGIFYIKDNNAFISKMSHYNPSLPVEFAIQSGPRLLIHGKIPSLKIGNADRSALGITAKGKVILLVSTNAAMSTNELAHLMKAPPLSCKEAINLDGGSSSQMYAHLGTFRLHVHGFSNVSDAIVVKAR